MSSYRSTFVSHAHVDNDLCDRYVAALRARGIDTWYDRHNAQAGHFLGTEIQRELEQRSAFVLLMTQPALDSFWVQLEMQAYLGLMAQDRSRLLLPVRIGRCAVPPFLNALFWIDALALPFEQAIDAMAVALLSQSASGVTAPHAASPTPPPPSLLPPAGPAPLPAGSTPALHLTPTTLYSQGFRGYAVGGVECVLPPVCPVPGGIFTMGSDKARDKEAQDNETPQYLVEVAGFAIGQYPVTVAEYACFVRAGHGEPGDWQQQRSRVDHPVVSVSWNDAVAYAAWLSERTGQPWRLPTEAEWEKAARWDPQARVSRLYPWGDSFDKARCNTTESGINTTTPVGKYPSGASPYGAQDMAGNVWEWTSSLHKLYPYTRADGREDQKSTGNRVLRGGSWINYARDARAACRGSNRPENVNSTDGFRLVVGVSAGS